MSNQPYGLWPRWLSLNADTNLEKAGLEIKAGLDI
jgi:hypothetical protein